MERKVSTTLKGGTTRLLVVAGLVWAGWVSLLGLGEFVDAVDSDREWENAKKAWAPLVARTDSAGVQMRALAVRVWELQGPYDRGEVGGASYLAAWKQGRGDVLLHELNVLRMAEGLAVVSSNAAPHPPGEPPRARLRSIGVLLILAALPPILVIAAVRWIWAGFERKGG